MSARVDGVGGRRPPIQLIGTSPAAATGHASASPQPKQAPAAAAARPRAPQPASPAAAAKDHEPVIERLMLFPYRSSHTGSARGYLVYAATAAEVAAEKAAVPAPVALIETAA